MSQKSSWVVGVDEAGRGPLAGPVTVASFMAPKQLEKQLVKILGGKIKDSKQLLEKRRGETYKEFNQLRKEGKIYFFVSHVSSKVIDKKGISYATRLGVRRSLNFLTKETSILLDGLLKAPEEYENQQTIIHGDSTNVFIACASIVAKVRRDALMRRYAKIFPQYKFDIHKGYGTLLHRRLIRKHGPSPLHRTTFCKKF